MIRDTAGIRMIGVTVAVEQSETIEGSFQVDCVAGWELTSSAVADCTCEIKHSAGGYAGEGVDISLDPWDGATETFNFRITADASAIDKVRTLPLQVRRAV